ncbi:MAG TPA: ABC transporter permease [Acidobacteriaceae bacterium]|nr:ABC transporter permease [Acidobacteriaceae bacterium]
MLNNLRFAVRQLRRSPGFALAVIVTLALGIGVNAAVFSMVDGFMLRRLPYPQPQRIAALMTHAEGTGRSGHYFTEEDDSHNTSDWRLASQDIPSVTAAAWEGDIGVGQSGVNLQAGADTAGNTVGAVRFVHAKAVTTHYFQVLGIHPYLGRGFTADESRPGGPEAVVLSYGLWQTMFHGDRSIIGHAVQVKGQPYTIVGVLPQNAATPGGSGTELWDSLQPGQGGACTGYDCGILMRLKPGATWQQVDAELVHAHRAPNQNFGPSTKTWLYAQPMQQYLGSDMKPKVLVLMLAVGFILLIACANLAGLALVRIARRTPELATRLALGATRFDLLRQMWAESLLLAFIGAAAGLMLANAILQGLTHLLPPGMIPLGGFILDSRVLAFTVIVTLLTSLFFGALPALSARRIDLRTAIAQGSKSVSGGSRRLRGVLISAEVALTVMLVAASGLLVRTLVHLETLPPGFDSHNVMTATVSLDEFRYHNAATFQQLMTQSVAAMKRIPGVEDAAAGLSVPYQRGLNLPIRLDDGKNTGNRVSSSTAYITPGYFSTLRMPMLAGRSVRDTDTATSEPVAVVNQAFARKFFGSPDVVGRHFSLAMGPKMSGPPMTIVGVVGNVTKVQGIVRTAPLGTEPVYYVPAAQFPADALATVHMWFQPSWIARTSGPIAGLATEMQQAMADADPNLPISGFHSMDQLMQQQLETQRMEVLLLGVLAGLALLLSAVGIYALVSNLVVQRTREIGIRMALGSSVERAMREIGASGLFAAGAGLIVGMGLSLIALRVLRSELYGVGVYDPITLIAAPLLLVLVALVASLLPVLRISRIDPAQTLRSE